MILLAAWSAALASAAVLAMFLARLGLQGRLFSDALAIGATLGATTALILAPFDLRTNPFHFAPATVAFLFAGAPEEAIKFLGAVAFLRGHFRVRNARDVVLASGALGLGFATLENLFYLANAGGAWATLAAERALTAGPFHVLLGLAGGFAAARLPATFGGAALGVATGAGLAAIHGAYDFAVLAGAAPPEDLRSWAARVGLDPVAALRGLMIAAEAAAAISAALALRFSRRGPEATGRLRRLLHARALGWGLTVALAGGAVIATLAGGVVSYAFDTFDALGAVLIFAALPFAFGVLAAPEPRPLSRRVRRALGALAIAALGAGAVVAVMEGPAGWLWLDMTRWEARGGRFAASRDYARAEEAFSRAIADAPERVEPLLMRAKIRVAAHRLDAALGDLDAALRLAPGAAPIYAQRADVQRQRNAPAAALADLNAALRLASDDVTLLALRAQAKLETGDAKGAYDDIAQASRRAPDAPLVRDIFAAWDVDAGDFDAAVRDLNARLHDHPGDADAIFRRGRAWFYKGEFARADADFASAEAGGQGLYPALWQFLAQTRLLAPGEASLRGRLATTTAVWPAPVARLLLGEIDLAAARALAADDGERCEADFYFAASRLGLDPSETSAARLRAAMGECPTAFIEYEGAKAELRRLEL
jgi:tetratricopeptide (TPR) repeat protein